MQSTPSHPVSQTSILISWHLRLDLPRFQIKMLYAFLTFPMCTTTWLWEGRGKSLQPMYEDPLWRGTEVWRAVNLCSKHRMWCPNAVLFSQQVGLHIYWICTVLLKSLWLVSAGFQIRNTNYNCVNLSSLFCTASHTKNERLILKLYNDAVSTAQVV